ncbi:MAG TPA: cell division ATP-binding protein FtsE [Myxococcales bacterium]|mgnify:CR=1 FL=1|nr:cell division ATP-binding protein FtsE [Deltaproteobacteria bacterium]MBU51007.1 cell division ATP-binding protein FtsE [Deltaproteobacteria bacterium]HAA54894.1 cell division ATP-binding protein FtsE [Myxococcales bacterium]|tara:strand:+ start:2557 stop:3279 length:723 start_codon:yes stop_codon:yes gene_type:complete
MIRLSQLTKEYQDGLPILFQIDLHIRRGEFVYLTGRSGAGKSTLLKLLFAQEKPTSGELVVGGMELHSMKRAELPYFRRKIGVVYQDFKLLPRRSVYENVAFALEVIGRPPREIKQKVGKILREVNLLHCSEQLPELLSGGEKQRVAIARALVHEPWLLLADEPTGNLDPALAREIMELFDRANKGGTTILLATHDLDLLQYGGRSRRILEVKAGSVCEFKDDHDNLFPTPPLESIDDTE